MKLFGVQRRGETAKRLQFMAMMKTRYDCGTNTKVDTKFCQQMAVAKSLEFTCGLKATEFVFLSVKDTPTV
jgi:hypothetical protein